MVFAVWAAPEPLVGRPHRPRARARRLRAARARRAGAARARGERGVRLPARLPRALLREAPLQLRAARARWPLHLPRDGPRRRRARRTSPSSASFARRFRRELTEASDRLVQIDTGSSVVDVRSRRRSTASGSRDEDAVALLRSRDLVAVGRVANEVRNRLTDPVQGDVHRRPEPQLHERLRHRLRLLRVLPPPGRPARGLPAAEAGHLQEDRGDARDRRHRRPHAGRAPSRPRRSTTTRISSARSRRATRSTCTRSPRPRSSTSRAARSSRSRRR